MDKRIDFVEYLRMWASTNPNDQSVRDLHKAADEIERLRKLVTEAGKSLSHVSVLADMMQKSEDELIEIHHGKCAEQFAEQGNEIEDLRAELAECQRQYQKEKQARNRWTQCAERLVEWGNKEGFMDALDFYHKNQRLDREDVV